MGIFSLIYQKLIKNQEKNLFFELCKNNDLKLDFSTNIDSFEILKEIFIDRCYSDYFPFYEEATIVDIGAHKGYFSIFSAQNTKKNSKIYAIEPSSKNFETLKNNTFVNKIQNITTFNIGIYSEKKDEKLYLGKSENNSFFSDYQKSITNENNHSSEIVKTLTLSDFLKQEKLTEIDFLKIDCEGSEYPILLNTDSETFSKIKVISLEFHDLKNEKYTPNKLLRFIKNQNFDIVKFTHERSKINNNYGKIIAVNKGSF